MDMRNTEVVYVCERKLVRKMRRGRERNRGGENEKTMEGENSSE